MSDFEKSFFTGINLAKQASNNIAEINEVIKKMSLQLLKLSGGKVTLAVGNFYDANQSPLLRITQEAKTHKALGIYDADGKNGVEIAEWTQHENGYPCTISSDSGRFYCKNKTELEGVISELFKQVKIGKEILIKMNNA